MGFRKAALLAGLMAAAMAAVGGCSYHHDDGGAEVVPAGYAVDDPYYDQGTYQNDYWVWHDREGHEHREARAEHERRAGASYDNRSTDAGRRDMGSQETQRRDSAASHAQEQQRAREQQQTSRQQQQRQEETSRNQSHQNANTARPPAEGHPTQEGGRNIEPDHDRDH